MAPATRVRDRVLEEFQTETPPTWETSASSKGSHEATVKASARKVNEMDFEMLQQRMKEEITLAEKLRRQSNSKNSTGDKAISFLSDFLEFAGEFSGILEIMKELDQGYGGAGYAVLSSLLAVITSAHPSFSSARSTILQGQD